MADLSNLTDRQREIYEFIRDQIETTGYPPTVRDIGDAFKIQSPNGVMCHLKALEKKGLINRKGNRARAIVLSEHKYGFRGVPLLGRVAAGTPIEAAVQDERLILEDLFHGSDYYALRVKGTSMIEDHIEDGDFVIVRKAESADNGERVVAMIDNEVTLKRFYKERNHIRLMPANSDMNPIIVNDTSNTRVLGVLAGVLRRC